MISKDIFESLSVVNENLLRLKDDLNLMKKRKQRSDLTEHEEFKTIEQNLKRQ